MDMDEVGSLSGLAIVADISEEVISALDCIFFKVCNPIKSKHNEKLEIQMVLRPRVPTGEAREGCSRKAPGGSATAPSSRKFFTGKLTMVGFFSTCRYKAQQNT
jgi:hypothetical protein